MVVYKSSFQVSTKNGIDLVNISSSVSRVVKESEATDGLILVFSPHTTTALLINEDESGLLEDIRETVKDIVPWKKNYRHNRIDHNAPAHIASALFGGNVSLSLEKGQIELGTWQSIFLLELDGPRTRNVLVKVLS